MAFNTPVILIIYNRPKITNEVFNAIRKIKPTQFFIVADGAKNLEDEKLVAETRTIVNKIDWECELHLDFSEINLGCSDRIVSGLNTIFEKIDSAIILEDDCLPHPSFFQFCEEMLAKYKDDNQIMHISGFNVMGNSPINESYFFSKYILPPWGWATWKRAWKLQNNNFDTWQQIKIWAYKNISQEYFTDWTDLFEGARTLRKTWDVAWNVDLWKNNALGIIPQKNLVKNIGFGKDATFTKDHNNKLNTLTNNNIDFPLKHPLNFKTDFDKLIEREIIEAVRINRKLNE